jgi:hypothetical protein
MFRRSSLPPRGLLALIVGVTVIPLATLLWLGWRLLEQDRALEAQQIQQRLDRSADLVVAAIDRSLSTWEQRLAAGMEEVPDGTVVVTVRGEDVLVTPRSRVAFLPVVPALPEPPASAFAASDAAEYRTHDLRAAAALLIPLTRSADDATRTGALLRLARVQQNLGQTDAALVTYARLLNVDDVGISGVPAALVARYLRCRLFEARGRRRTDDLTPRTDGSSTGRRILKVALRHVRRQEERREASVQQAMRKIAVAEVGQVRLDHRREPQVHLPPGERVPEAAARAEGRGASGQDADGGKVVGRDLEQLGGVGQAMHFVEDHSPATQPVKKFFRVFHGPPDARQFAIEVFDVRQGGGEGGLPGAPDATQPEHGATGPQAADLIEPMTALNHKPSYCRLVILNAILLTPGDWRQRGKNADTRQENPGSTGAVQCRHLRCATAASPT